MILSDNFCSTDNILNMNGIKSTLTIVAFFLMIYMFGKCVLTTVKNLWGLIVISIALFLSFATSPENKLVNKIQESADAITEKALNAISS